ncbi:MAG: glucose-6-phosphate isomerase [Mycoplasmataceae bacterium]|nr:glucose-6-phosphate isomerase [Mycoplasmataceae bacterium]
MLKLNLNLSTINKEQKKKYLDKVSKIHEMIRKRLGKGNEFMDWLTWPVDYDKQEIERIIKKVNWMKSKKIETLLVIGIGGSYLGAQSAIDFIKGKIEKQDEIIFSGINISSAHIKQIERKLKNKKWGICVISKSGTTLEPALSFRYFKSLLEKKEGTDKAKDYIVVVTDNDKGALKSLANKKEYDSYSIPNGIGGRFSGMTPVGTFPMIFADIDVIEIFKGAEKAMKDFSSLENNLAYEYALTRFILYTEQNKVLEIFTTYDFDLGMMSEWWKQLFGESEGKDGKALMPLSVEYSRDLHSLGQIIQEGKSTFLETTLWIEKDHDEIIIQNDKLNLDGLNYLSGMSFHDINKKAFKGVVEAHYKSAGTPNIIITLKDKTEFSMGYLWYFFFIGVTMSSYLLEVNPFDQPGVELYKKNMFKNLGDK